MPDRSRTILIADTSEEVRKLLAFTFTHYGFKVISAASAQEACTLFGSHQAELDAVLLDVHLPPLGGVGVVQMVRAIKPTVRCFLMGGYSEGDTEVQVADVIQFFAKPFANLEFATKTIASSIDQRMVTSHSGHDLPKSSHQDTNKLYWRTFD